MIILLVYRKSKSGGIKTSMMEPFFRFEYYSSREFETLSKRTMQFLFIKMLNKWDSSDDDNNVGN